MRKKDYIFELGLPGTGIETDPEKKFLNTFPNLFFFFLKQKLKKN